MVEAITAVGRGSGALSNVEIHRTPTSLDGPVDVLAMSAASSGVRGGMSRRVMWRNADEALAVLTASVAVVAARTSCK